MTLSLGVDKEYRAPAMTMAALPVLLDPMDPGAVLYAGHSELLVQTALVRADDFGKIHGKRPHLNSTRAIVDLCAHLRDVPASKLVILAVSEDLVLDAIHESSLTGDNENEWKIRQVAKTSLILDAEAVIVVESRRVDVPEPKRGDLAMARAMRDAVRAIGLDLIDYVILGRKGYASFVSKR